MNSTDLMSELTLHVSSNSRFSTFKTKRQMPINMIHTNIYKVQSYNEIVTAVRTMFIVSHEADCKHSRSSGSNGLVGWGGGAGVTARKIAPTRPPLVAIFSRLIFYKTGGREHDPLIPLHSDPLLIRIYFCRRDKSVKKNRLY